MKINALEFYSKKYQHVSYTFYDSIPSEQLESQYVSPRKSLRNEFNRSTNEYELKTKGSISPQSARKNESNGCEAALGSESCSKEMKDNAVQESLNKLFES